MLFQIIHQFQEFQRIHQTSPNVVYLNADHYAVLREDYSELFSDYTHPDVIIPLELRVVLVPKALLSAPRVASIEPGSSQIFNCKSASLSGKSFRLKADRPISYRSAQVG
jgi:hypothetical protein